MKIALIHDWLNGMRGGEKVLEVLTELFPEAHIYTLLYEPAKISPVIKKLQIHTSFIQHLPFHRRYYRWYLPLFPFAVSRFKLSDYDLVISTSHCVAKGARVPNGIVHICFCFTPMRYVWDFSKEYFRNKVIAFLIRPILAYLKHWDRKTAVRPDYFFSISQNVASRIKKYYNRKAGIIYPPVDTDYFVPQDIDGNFYLIVSALVPYKRIDIAVEAFNRLGLPLRIIGAGTEWASLRRRAGANIEFLGWQPNNILRDSYARCRAFIFPGIEDFGITVLEAQSSGRPVIAYAEGGAIETVKDSETGVFFYKQDSESLVKAVRHFEQISSGFNKEKIRQNALLFSRNRFKQELRNEIQRVYNIYSHN